MHELCIVFFCRLQMPNKYFFYFFCQFNFPFVIKKTNNKLNFYSWNKVELLWPPMCFFFLDCILSACWADIPGPAVLSRPQCHLGHTGLEDASNLPWLLPCPLWSSILSPGRNPVLSQGVEMPVVIPATGKWSAGWDPKPGKSGKDRVWNTFGPTEISLGEGITIALSQYIFGMCTDKKCI